MPITNSQLRSKLPTGITLSTSTFPDEDDALLAVINMLRALEEAQDEQNASAPTGEDVAAIAVAYGAEELQTIDGNSVRVRRATRTVSCFEQQAVTNVYPILV